MGELPEGFDLKPDFIGREDETRLLSAIQSLEFREFQMHGVTAKRRVVQFGWRYSFGTYGLTPTLPCPKLSNPFARRPRDLPEFPRMISPRRLSLSTSRAPVSGGTGTLRHSTSWQASRSPEVAGCDFNGERHGARSMCGRIASTIDLSFDGQCTQELAAYDSADKRAALLDYIQDTEAQAAGCCNACVTRFHATAIPDSTSSLLSTAPLVTGGSPSSLG